MAGAVAGILTGVIGLSLLDVALTGKDAVSEFGTASSLAASFVKRLVDPTVPLIGSAASKIGSTAADVGSAATKTKTGPTVKPLVLA